MEKAKVLFILAGWIMLMGLFGAMKTGVLMPILINGALAVRTSVLGWFTYRGCRWGYWLTMIWLAVSTVGGIYYCFNDNGFFTVSNADGYMMFGSISFFSFLTFIYLIKLRKNLPVKK